jgi:ribulose 1,5-bisphosphate synthetase/thiazole synthase
VTIVSAAVPRKLARPFLDLPHVENVQESETSNRVDVAIVEAGIVGLGHVYIAAHSGRSVVVFERNLADGEPGGAAKSKVILSLCVPGSLCV